MKERDVARFLERNRTMDFESIDLEPFAKLPPALRSSQFFCTNEDVNTYVDLQTLMVLRTCGVEPDAALSLAGLEPLRYGIATDRIESWRWLITKLLHSRLVEGHLVEGHLVEGHSDGPPAVSLAADRWHLPEALDDLISDVRRSLLDVDSGLAPVLDLVDLAAAQFPGFLRGAAVADSIFFSADRAATWERYFSRENPLYAPINELTAHVFRELFDREPAREESIRVVEVGAGCGSAAEAILEKVGSNLSYHVTDIAPTFLSKARERLASPGIEAMHRVSFELLDLDRPESWRLEPESVDVIVAVNVLHTVGELDAALGELRRSLRPGGSLLIGECIRPEVDQPVHPEFTFQLLDRFRRVSPEPPYRLRWGFLDGVSWQRLLKRRGFSWVRSIPDVAAATRAYSLHSASVFVATR